MALRPLRYSKENESHLEKCGETLSVRQFDDLGRSFKHDYNGDGTLSPA